MKENTQGLLEVKNEGNELYIKSTENGNLGYIGFNYLFGPTSVQISHLTKKCQNIYFKFGGEHYIDSVKGDLDVILNCTDVEGQDYKTTLIVNRVKKLSADDIAKGTKQNAFFNSFDNISTVPVNLTINGLSDLLNEFSMYDDIYGYSGIFILITY